MNKLKQFFRFHWDRFLTWLQRVQALQQRIDAKDKELNELRGTVSSLQWEVEFVRKRAEQAEKDHLAASHGSYLLARWIKTTHRLGDVPPAETIKRILHNAQQR